MNSLGSRRSVSKTNAKCLKEIERRLISELMKNSRRSDREFAKTIGVSQPTISRMIKKLEKEGYIKQYTIVPDFNKLGYELMALTLLKLKETLTPEEAEKVSKNALGYKCRLPPEVIMFERGTCSKYDGVAISMHPDYSSYMKLKAEARAHLFFDFSEMEDFLISLDDEVRGRPLTLATLAEHLLMLKAVEKR